MHLDNDKRRYQTAAMEKNDIQQHFSNDVCAYGNCKREPIQSHVLQKSGPLKVLANSEGKVIERWSSKGFPRLINDLIKSNNHQLDQSYQLTPIKAATTFSGFCSKHDDEIFKKIETETVDPSDTEFAFLMAYRSLVNVYTLLTDISKDDISLRSQRIAEKDESLLQLFEMLATGLKASMSEENRNESASLRDEKINFERYISDNGRLRENYDSDFYVLVERLPYLIDFANIGTCMRYSRLGNRVIQSNNVITVGAIPCESKLPLVLVVANRADVEIAKVIMESLRNDGSAAALYKDHNLLSNDTDILADTFYEQLKKNGDMREIENEFQNQGYNLF